MVASYSRVYTSASHVQDFIQEFLVEGGKENAHVSTREILQGHAHFQVYHNKINYTCLYLVGCSVIFSTQRRRVILEPYVIFLGGIPGPPPPPPPFSMKP